MNPTPSPSDGLSRERLRIAELEEALEPFAVFAGDLSIPKNRFFLQILVCPEGDDHPENYGPHFQRARELLASRTTGTSSPEGSGEAVAVKALEWKDYRGDGSRQAKTPYGEVLWATPNGWGNRNFPEQIKGLGLEANMAAAEANHRAIVRSCLVTLPQQEHTPEGGEALAVLKSYWLGQYWNDCTYEDCEKIEAAFKALAAKPTEVGEDMVERALDYWCAKLPKALREQPIPDKLKDHMRETIRAALNPSSAEEKPSTDKEGGK